MKSVLVVDDHVALVNSSANALKSAGYEVTKCYDGGNALHQLQTRKFDFLVTDYHMPVRNGLQLLDFIIEQKLDTGVILITSHHQNSKNEEAFTRFKNYPRGLVLVKPFESAIVLQKLQELEDKMRSLAPIATTP